MHAPRDIHLTFLNSIIHYVQGTSTLVLHLCPMSSVAISAYFDADWVGCHDTRRSMSRYCVFLGDSPVSWSSKHQTTIFWSSIEVAYCVITNAVADCSWLRQLLREIHVIIQKATMAFYDVISTIYMTHNLVHHRRLEHIELNMRSWEGGHWWSSCDTCTH